MRREPVTKTFTITADPGVLERFERLLCMMQTGCAIGHSGTFGMSLDGDGADRFKVKESLRKYRNGAMKIGGVGYSVELATGAGYSGLMQDRDRKCRWSYADSGQFTGETGTPKPRYGIKTESMGRIAS